MNKTFPAAAVEVCEHCDIADCRHIRERRTTTEAVTQGAPVTRAEFERMALRLATVEALLKCTACLGTGTRRTRLGPDECGECAGTGWKGGLA